MAVAVVEKTRTCASCGDEFVDRSRTSPRSYCYACSPLPVKRAEEPARGRPRVLLEGVPNTVEHFEAWASELVLDTGDQWRVEPFFLEYLEDVFAGYAETWLVVPEGNTKTTSMSGLALYHCEFTDYAWAPWAASARDQAEIGYIQAEGFVERTPRLRGVFRCHPGYRRIRCTANGSRIQIFAADDRTGDGVIPTLALLDELHRHRNLRLYRTWRGKLLKRGGQLATFSTAGEPFSEFEETREQIRQAATEVTRKGRCFVRAATKQVVLHDYSVPEKADVEDLELVKEANPFSGITVDALREKFESPTMTLPHWRRFVCNLPTRSDRSAITEAEWAAAEVDDDIPVDEAIWLGVDVGWKWDTTALVPLWLPEKTRRVFGHSRVLVPPRDGSSLDHTLIERAVLEVNARNPIHTVVMDMHRAEQLASWLEETLDCRVVDRGQGNAEMADDYEAFMEGLRLGQVKVQRDDHDFKRHAMNAVVKLLPGGGARFDRPSSTRQGGDQDARVIDALTSGAMVHRTALQNQPTRKFGGRALLVA